jgi:hypothetical protein
MIRTSIGLAPQFMDLVTAVAMLAFFIAFLIVSVFDNDFVLFVIIGAICGGIELVRINRRHYIYVADGNFIIEHLYKSREIVPCSLYKRISQNPFSLPFSNTLQIQFSNGKRFNFRGGMKSFQEWDLIIKRLLLS